MKQILACLVLMLLLFSASVSNAVSFTDLQNSQWNVLIEGQIIGTLGLGGCTFSPCVPNAGGTITLNGAVTTCGWAVEDNVIDVCGQFTGAVTLDGSMIVGSADNEEIILIRK